MKKKNKTLIHIFARYTKKNELKIQTKTKKNGFFSTSEPIIAVEAIYILKV